MGTGSYFYDLEVGGNVVLNSGAGRVSQYFDGSRTALPVLIHGSLSLTGAGGATADVGGRDARTGMVVGKNLTVVGGAASDAVVATRLTVIGTTNLKLGNGDNLVAVDDSLFVGSFSLTTGTGIDTVTLDTATGSGAATTFNRAVKMSLGAGVDVLTLGGNSDANQTVVFASTCIVRHGAEGESANRFGKDSYTFGSDLQWIV